MKALKSELDELNQTINEKLSGITAEGNQASPEPQEKKYLVVGRVDLPAMGGLALPKGVGFHAYVDTIVDHNEVEQLLEVIEALAEEEYPNHVGIHLHAVSEVTVSE
ncbi:MAG: hypothetical protein AAF741_15675 [Bacteroidota bacterium]